MMPAMGGYAAAPVGVIDGSRADVAVAPEIGVGNWVDTAPAAGSVGKSYRFRRTVPGSTLWVGLAFTNPTDLTGTRVVALDVLLSDGEGLSRCDGATASAFGGSGIGSAQGLFSALVTSFGSSNADCDTTGLADREISGSLKCTERWCASQTWRKKTL
mgnify:CR=1 FL=1